MANPSRIFAARRATTIAVYAGRFSTQFMWARMAGPTIPLAALLLISTPGRDRCAAGQDAIPAINPDCCEQEKQCPSGEAEQDPDRDWHQSLQDDWYLRSGTTRGLSCLASADEHFHTQTHMLRPRPLRHVASKR